MEKLNIPDVVKVFEIKNFGHSMVMVLEDFGGISLKTYIEGKKLELKEALEISLQAASALGQIHAQGIIHKDIKAQQRHY